jgi:hypothetical protein
VAHMPMAPPLVPPPMLRPARPPRGPAALAVPGPALAPASLTVLDQAIKMGWAAVWEAAPALGLATRLALVLAINPAEVVTKSRFGGK